MHFARWFIGIAGMAALVFVTLLVGSFFAIPLFVVVMTITLASRVLSSSLVALVLGFLGGVIAVPNVILALVVVGNSPIHSDRVGFAWAALALAILASAAPAAALARPTLAGSTMLFAGIGGAIAITGFYINTFYVVAVPFWISGAMVSLLSPKPSQIGVKSSRRPMLLRSGGVVAVLLLVGIASSAVLLGRSSYDQPSPPAQARSAFVASSTDRLILSDDFSNPGGGLFQDSRLSTSRGTYGDGTTYQYKWQYSYADRALVFLLSGPSPAHSQLVFPYVGVAAVDKVSADFAIEVRARATNTPERARYGIDYVVMGEDRYRFEVAPGPGFYGLSLGPLDRNFMARGQSSLVNRGGEENLLRMEVRGSTMKVFLNGQALDQAQHEGLARRGGTIELVMGMFGPPTDAPVEVQIMDFRVYSLAP